MIAAESLRYNYNSQEELFFPDVRCGAGEAMLILGASGSGKTTFLHLLAGLRKADKGTILIDGKSISDMNQRQLDSFRGRHIGLVFQQAHFIPSIKVKENLQLARTLAGLRPDDAKMEHYLDHLSIAHKADAYPKNLSVGEQQRLSIAMALINGPKLILADEPTSALDDHNAQQVIQLLKDESRLLGSALIIVTHDQRMKEHFENQIHL